MRLNYCEAKICPATPCRLQGGEEIQLLLILYLGTRWGWVVSVTSRPRFPPGRGPSIPIVQEAGWASELVWTQKLEEKSFAPARDWTPVVQFVVRHYTDWATPALPKLLYCYKLINNPMVADAEGAGEEIPKLGVDHDPEPVRPTCRMYMELHGQF
jgi:hypothetical protein